MRPPVPWANTSVEQIRQRLRTTSPRYIRDNLDDGMEQVLQFSGTILFAARFNLRAT
jgi:hypothetical protein